MNVYAPVHRPIVEVEENCLDDDNDTTDYACDDLILAAQNHNWSFDLHQRLKWSPDELKDKCTWLVNTNTHFIARKEVDDSADAANLNQEQKTCYYLVTGLVDRKLTYPLTRPFYLNLSGAAGCGKSYLLKCINKYIRSTLAKVGFHIIAAPTGCAATQIDGSTLHSLLSLISNFAKGKDIPDVSPGAVRDFEEKFRDTELLIIDEKSMVSLELLSQINARLMQFKVTRQDDKGETMPFGGISIILMGDFSQLPPVKDKPLYIDPGKKNFQHLKGSHLYKLFDKAIVLKQIMRQQGDEEMEFRNVLTNLSSGNFTEKDWRWLQLRDLKQMTQVEQESFFQQGIKLCALNRDAIGYNILKIRGLGKPIALIYR